jgi:hypothetical protein
LGLSKGKRHRFGMSKSKDKSKKVVDASGEHTTTQPAKPSGKRVAIPNVAVSNREKSAVEDRKQSIVDPKIQAHRMLMEQKKKEAEDAEKLGKMIAALKQAGKDFTTDSAGRIIPIRSSDVKGATGTRNIDLATDIVEERNERIRLEEARLAAEQPKRTTTSSFTRKKKPKQNLNKVPPGTWIKPDDSTGPMIEELKPGAGIMYRTDETVQRNDLKPVAGKMSKSEFKKHYDAQEAANENQAFEEQMQAATQRGNSSQTTRAAAEHKKASKADDKGYADASAVSITPLMISSEALPSAAFMQQPVDPVTLINPLPTPQTYKAQPPPSLPAQIKHGVQGYSSILGERTHFPKERPFLHRRVVDNVPEHLPPPVYPALRGHGIKN